MTWDLSTGAGGARRDVVLDEGADTQPGILSADQVQSAGLTKVSGEWVVMFVPQDLQMEVIGVRNVVDREKCLAVHKQPN